MFIVYARNLKTNCVLEMDSFNTIKEAEWCINNSISWDEDDDPTEWNFFIEEFDDDDYDDSYDYDYSDIECGFDPYMGCYSDDC